MRILPGTKLLACAAKEQGRYAMHGVAIVNGKELVATNGRALVRIPINGEMEDGAYVFEFVDSEVVEDHSQDRDENNLPPMDGGA